MKIFLSGPSGIGKTTMAKHIAKLYGIKFVEGSSKVLWGDFGIKSHLDLIQKCDKDTIIYSKNLLIATKKNWKLFVKVLQN